MLRKLTALLMLATLLLGMSTAFAWSCPNCNNEMDGKFCGECGTKRPENICVSCGANFGVTAPKFCSECGTKMGAKSVPTAEKLTASAKGLLSDVKVTVTLNTDGTIATMVVDASGETTAIAAPCTKETFLSQFIGKKGPFDNIDVVGGATFTSNAVLEAVNSLFPAEEAAVPAEEAIAPAVWSTKELQALSYDELVSLKDKINLAIWNSQEWREVEVPQGVWVVGEDIPAGTWTVTCTTEAGWRSCYLDWGEVLKPNGQEIAVKSGTRYDYLRIYNPNHKYYEAGDGDTSYTFTVRNGDYIVIKDAPAVFTPYAGKPSLGFK